VFSVPPAAGFTAVHDPEPGAQFVTLDAFHTQISRSPLAVPLGTLQELDRVPTELT